MILNNDNNHQVQYNADNNSAEKKAQKKGRGWHGDSERHANAGRKGGLARRKKKPDPQSQ